MIAVTMWKLIFAMVLGFFLNKKGIFDKYTNKKISSLIINVTCPMLIITSMSSIKKGNEDAIIFLLISGIVTYLILPVFSYFVCKILKIPKDYFGIYRCMIMFSNNSFMGFPVVEALYGASAIFYVTIYHFGFNILFFSYATFIMAKDAGMVNHFEKRQLLSPGMLSGIIALIIYLTGIKLPEVIISPMQFVGSVTVPLSMLIIGSNMADYSLKDIFEEKKIYAISVIRLIVIPFMVYEIISLFTNDPVVTGVITVTMGMPVASLVAMGSSMYEKQGKAGSLGVVVTTIFSMITIPVMVYFLL